MGDAYSLVVKMLDFLSENKVFQQSWASLTSLQAVLVGNGPADVAGEVGVVVIEVELR